MRERGVFIRTSGSGFTPGADDRARRIFNGVPEGERVMISVHKARHPEYSSFVYAALTTIAGYMRTDLEPLLIYIKRELGLFDFVILPDGSVEKDWHSLSPESMSQKEFEQFWNDAKVLLRKWVPNLDDIVDRR